MKYSGNNKNQIRKNSLHCGEVAHPSGGGGSLNFDLREGDEV